MIAKRMFKLFTAFHIWMYRQSNGQRMNIMRGMPVLLLTTTGRKTGKQRTTPLMYIEDGENVVITASAGGDDADPAWFKNLQTNPRATVEIKGITQTVVAQVAEPEQKAPLWSRLISQAPFFGEYQRSTTREIPMVILQPEA
ncbi:MAG: nitroreductase family deazaflavin-dependent oxidoreductase [Burkholderiales bacterium]|nr:nitroreductase family deazaflavin-dependent oxidoreductase [Anaerolineae bacterium]